MKTALPRTALLALVGLTLVPLASANGPGVCAGICIEVTKVDPADVTTVTQTQVQTCAGNVVVQVGVDNDANFCTGQNQTSDTATFRR